MDSITMAGFVLLGLAVITVLVAIIIVVLRSLRLRTRIKAIAHHPTLLSLQRAPLLMAQTADLPERVSRIATRVERISANVDALLSASALLRSDVARIGRTTEGLLGTFVPLLRGSF